MNLALSIQGNTLRLLAVEGRQVIGWDSVFFNPSLLRLGHVAEAEQMAKVIRMAMENKHWRGGKVLAAIENFSSQSAVVSIPTAKGVKPAEVIPREARRLMGVSPETDFLFWEALPQKGRYFVLSTPKEVLTGFLRMLRSARLKPYRVDTSALALARAINQPNAVAACAESNEVYITVVVDYVPEIIHSHFLGEMPQPTEAVTDALLERLEHTLSYYNDTHPAAPINSSVPLFLCGAALPDQEMASQLEERVGLKVQPLPCPLKAPEDFPVALFMANLGLIMKEW